MDALEQIAAAVLYEGYVLWPYRRSARKNQQRWTFGGIYPPAFVAATSAGDRSCIQTQCIVIGARPVVDVGLRFLQVVDRRVARSLADGALEFVDELTTASGRHVLAWEEAIERRVAPGEVRIDAGQERESVEGGIVLRTWERLDGHIDVRHERIRELVWRVSATVANTSPWTGTERGLAQRHGFMSAHLVLCVRGGTFISMTDPPSDLAADVGACQNVGLWPVLVSDERTMLASPIILSDYPRIAPESPGLLFDSGEIDQLLYLNILTLTDAEKAEIRATDPRAREILDRAEALSPEELTRLHGAIRELRVLADDRAPDCVIIDGAQVRRGSAVRLHPHGRADAFDMLLDGKLATVESVEQDFEQRIQLAVTIDEDPGCDLGMDRMPGHRFFFAPAEVEPIV